MSHDQPDHEEFELQLRVDDDDGPPYPPVDDQRAVLASYFEGTGRVVVDASAGTGKTSTLVLTLAETIVRTATEDHNPLSEILLTTFGREATSELKTRLKAALRSHQAAGGDLPQTVFRWLETDSTIQTLDSLFAELLGEIAIEIGVPPEFEVDNRLELQRLRRDVLAELRAEYADAFRVLEDAYPAEPSREYPPQSVESMLFEAHQRCREFGISPATAVESLRASLVVSHGGARSSTDSTDGPESIPPEVIEDLEAILKAVVEPEAELQYDSVAAAEQLLEHAKSTYTATEKAIEAFGTLLVAFDQRYDTQTKAAGQFTFTDISQLLASYLDDCDADDPYLRTLGSRFDHVFVDEFQDTSAVQCAVLRRLVDPYQHEEQSSQPAFGAGQPTDPVDEPTAAPVEEPPTEQPRETDRRANLFVIGDSKQAIYEWRSADPALFAELIETASAAAPEPAASVPHLRVRDVQYHALSTVFRHHPDIAAAANHCFQRLLEDEARGAIGEHTPSYVPVEPYGLSWDTAGSDESSTDNDDPEQSHVHVLDIVSTHERLGSSIAADKWAPAEAERIAETIGAMLDAESESSIIIETDDGSRAPTAGDITLLFRSRRQLQRYATVLRDAGIPVTADASGDLFEQPEIELLVDILLWIATPYAERPLRRLLRSPLVALTDPSIRAALEATDLETLCASWPDRLPDDDRQRLAGLVSLRSDLGQQRETAKTALIHRLVMHSGFEALLLSDSEPLRRYGNVWLLSELVDEWELDQLLSYREFCSRLRQLRTNTDSSDPQFAVAETTDPVSPAAVRLQTVHQAKGKEYPIVFLCDLPKPSNYPRLQHKRLLASRRYGFALRPRPGEPPSPDGVTFPTPDSKLETPVWFNDEFDTDYPDATGPIWLSDARDNSGAFRYANPLNAHLTANEAEFWRLAYVAFTRAEDHVFLGLGDLDSNSNSARMARWSTWLAGFNETLQPDSGWSSISGLDRSERIHNRQLSWSTTGGDTVSYALSIGVDELPSQSSEPADAIGLVDELARLDEPPAEPTRPPFRPQQLSASSLGELVECPRAFQYRYLQQVEPAGGVRPTPPASKPVSTPRATQSRPPGGLSATEWGSLVHELIEAQLTDNPQLKPAVDQQPEAVRDALQTVRSALESTTIFEQSLSAADLFVEYELTELHPTPGADLRLTGIVDLLYRLDGNWHLVDWKTGRRPVEGAATAHRRQLSVYGWLLARQFGITVETATVAYIDPENSPVVSPIVLADLDTEWVDPTVETVASGLSFDSAGLVAQPEADRCGSCPFAEHNGGPCEADFHSSEP